MEREQEYFAKVKTELKDYGLMVFTDLRNKNRTMGWIKLNARNNYLEYEKRDSVQTEKIYFPHYMYSILIEKGLEPGIQIYLATNRFLPEIRTFYFFRPEDRDKLMIFLDINQNEQKCMTYINDLSVQFQNRELMPIQNNATEGKEASLSVQKKS